MRKNNNIELSKIENQRPFTLPNNYFDEFPKKMEELILITETKPHFRLRPWMYGVAASLVGVLIMVQVLVDNNKNHQLAQDAYETYVLSQINETSMIDYYLTAEND